MNRGYLKHIPLTLYLYQSSPGAMQEHKLLSNFRDKRHHTSHHNCPPGTDVSPYCSLNANGRLGPTGVFKLTVCMPGVVAALPMALGSPPVKLVNAVVRGVMPIGFLPNGVTGVLGMLANNCRLRSHFSSCVRPSSGSGSAKMAFFSSISSSYSSSRLDFSARVMKQLWTATHRYRKKMKL